MVLINNIYSCFRHWKKTHKYFFKRGNIRSDMFVEAQESFTHYLAIRNIPTFEVELYLPQLEYKESYWCTALPLVLGLALNSCQAHLGLNEKVMFYLWTGLIAVFLLSFPLIGLINRSYRRMSTVNAYFLRATLQKYVLHQPSPEFKNQLVFLRGNLPALVPTSSEYVYDDLMKSEKYYWSAWCVTVSNNNDTHSYVFFTNHHYGSDETSLKQNFIKQCFSQVGKHWQGDSVEFSIQEIKTINLLDI